MAPLIGACLACFLAMVFYVGIFRIDFYSSSVAMFAKSFGVPFVMRVFTHHPLRRSLMNFTLSAVSTAVPVGHARARGMPQTAEDR